MLQANQIRAECTTVGNVCVLVNAREGYV